MRKVVLAEELQFARVLEVGLFEFEANRLYSMKQRLGVGIDVT